MQPLILRTTASYSQSFVQTRLDSGLREVQATEIIHGNVMAARRDGETGKRGNGNGRPQENMDLTTNSKIG
jgi:hypothetical protein